MFRLIWASSQTAETPSIRAEVPDRSHIPSRSAAAFLCVLLIAAFLFPTGVYLLGERTHTDSVRGTAVGAVQMPTIVLDPGHGGEDGGATGISPLPEKDLNLALAQSLAQELEARGFRVVLTRTADVLLYDHTTDFVGHKKEQDLATRVRIAEATAETGETLFISIHMNSFTESRYRGLQVWYSKNDQKSYFLAKKVQEIVKNQLQPENERAVKEAGSRIYLLYRLRIPAILIECGFLTNPSDVRDLCDTSYREKLSSVIASAIEAYVSETGSQTEANPPAA